MQDDFTVVAGQDQVDARPFEIAAEEQVSIRNDYSVGRGMTRNRTDVDMRAQVSALTIRQHINKFAG
jgi:hypothetical protein